MDEAMKTSFEAEASFGKQPSLGLRRGLEPRVSPGWTLGRAIGKFTRQLSVLLLQRVMTQLP